jgi:hypothetical protein
LKSEQIVQDVNDAAGQHCCFSEILCAAPLKQAIGDNHDCLGEIRLNQGNQAFVLSYFEMD